MANYGCDKAFNELWNDICKLHFAYQDQEDNYDKIVKRKKLEGQSKINK